MKIKKFLKKAAEEDRESLINDRDIEFLASIGVDYTKKRVADQKEPDSSYYLTASTFNQKILISCIACFIVAALTVSLILYFYLKPAPIHYFEDNFVKVDSDLEELNADLNLYTLVVNEDEYDLILEKTYDSLSGDNLFYTMNFVSKQGFSKTFRLDIIVNSFYEHEQLSYNKEPVEIQNPNYTFKFAEDVESMSGTPFNKVTAKGEMQIGDQWIYIVKYEETALGESTFIQTLQSIISFK